MPALDAIQSPPTFQRVFELGPREKPLVLQVARGPKTALVTFPTGVDESADAAFLGATTDAGILASVVPHVSGMAWQTSPEGDLRLKLPPGSKPLRFTLGVVRVPVKTDVKALAATIKNPTTTDLGALMRGGPALWPEVLKTTRQNGRDDGPFAIDVLTSPDANPWNCRMRFSGLDFFSSGDALAVCTWDGDVWRVDGLNDPSGILRWKRFACGLFQPLGLKIVNDVVHVSCRDQIVALHDRNGDGEADFYENVNSDHQVTESFHEFAMDLQTDAEGNFYYTKAARHGKTAVVPQHGTLLKSPATAPALRFSRPASAPERPLPQSRRLVLLHRSRRVLAAEEPHQPHRARRFLWQHVGLSRRHRSFRRGDGPSRLLDYQHDGPLAGRAGLGDVRAVGSTAGIVAQSFLRHGQGVRRAP